MAIDQSAKIGIVVIGRNEGERLARCFDTLPAGLPVVYVDSDSTDGSVGLAKSAGYDVVYLSAAKPLSAGRARNAGLEYLTDKWPDLSYVQFLDGDCELFVDWLTLAQAVLDERPGVVAVCGQRHEKYPHATVYNELCAIEWNTPIGEALAVGGDSMMRIQPVSDAGGFDDSFVGGEEPELCYRLRQDGWKVLRIDAAMTVHDAAMDRWQQWWSRAARSGGAYAQSALKHGRGPEKFGVRESVSIWIYAAVLPLIAVALAPFTWRLSIVALLCGYLWQWYRIGRKAEQSHGLSREMANNYAASIVLGKFPHLVGQIRFFLTRKNLIVEKDEPRHYLG